MVTLSETSPLRTSGWMAMLESICSWPSVLGELLFDEVVHSHIALAWTTRRNTALWGGRTRTAPDPCSCGRGSASCVCSPGGWPPGGCCHCRHHTRQVVAFPVPRHLPHGLQRERRERKRVAGGQRSKSFCGQSTDD